MQLIILFAIALFFITQTLSTNIDSIFGVDPLLVAEYAPDQDSFTCTKSRKVIPMSQVNDDICDCLLDGSDEPGTSACNMGHFYCENPGYESEHIPSGHVNDHFCDCCDGADEYSTDISCPNICSELSHQNLAEKIERQRLEEAGILLKINLITGAEDSYKELLKLQIELKSQETTLKDTISLVDPEIEKLQKERNLLIAELKSNDEGSAVLETEIGIQDPLQVDQEQVETDSEETTDSTEEDDSRFNDHPKIQPIDEKLSPLLKEKSELDDSLKRVQGKLRETISSLSGDFGPDNAFLTLKDKCFSDTIDEYDYEICMFSKFTQKPQHGSSISLGEFEKWSGPEDDWRKLKHTQQLYSGGQSCWQGPKRSVSVIIECGETEGKLISVREPSKCEYEAVLQTAAAC